MVALYLSTPAHPPLKSGDPLLPAALLVVLQKYSFTPSPSFDAPVAGWDSPNQGSQGLHFPDEKEVGRDGNDEVSSHPANESKCVLI